MTVCSSPADCGTTSKLQTIWFTGNGEIFSSCSSTMERNSAGSHLGRWTTRKKTCSGGSQAMFSLFCHRVRQFLVTSLAGSGPGAVGGGSAFKLTCPLPVANCQSWRESGPSFNTLQECQRVVFTSGFHQSFHVLLGLGDAEHFFDGGQAGPHLVPAVVPQRAHPLFHGPGRDGRSWRAVQNQRTERFVEQQGFINAHAALVTQLTAFLTAAPAPELRGVDFVHGRYVFDQVIALHYVLTRAV